MRVDKKTGYESRFVYLVHWEFGEKNACIQMGTTFAQIFFKGQNCELVRQNVMVQYYSTYLSHDDPWVFLSQSSPSLVTIVFTSMYSKEVVQTVLHVPYAGGEQER